jgi:hypothetical protein
MKRILNWSTTRRSLTHFAAIALCGALGLFTSTVNAATIASGDLVIYRVGDGSAALGTTATAVFLDEYTTSGTLVQSIPLPATGTGSLTAVGNASTEGIISRTQDGSALVFTGYRKDAGGTSPAGDTYVTTGRVVGTVTLAGSPNLSTTITSDGGATTANTIRSATAVNSTAGSAIWTSTSSRIGYVGTALGNTGLGTTQIDARNSRQVGLADNIVYASNGSTAITGKVQQYGTLPTAATTATPVVTLGTADAVNGFILLDLSSSVAGADTLYALSTVANQLLKYTYDGTNWTASGSIAGGSGNNITAQVVGGNVNLYVTSTTALQTLTDSSGYGGTLTGTLASIASAGTNTGFRGIGTLGTPIIVPEPATLGLLGIVGLVACFRRRSTR